MTKNLSQNLEASIKQYLDLQSRTKTFEAIPEENRTLNIQGEKLLLRAGTEAPIMTPYGVGLIRVYDVRKKDNGDLEFGIGNETLPILCYLPLNRFYNEWPD